MTRRPALAIPASVRALNPAFAAAASTAPERSASARVAHARGDAFEALLAGHHARAGERGIADVRKVGAPVVVGRGGAPKAWAGVGPADYVGTLHGGRSLVVEAKSVDGRLSRADIAEHQRAHLDVVARLGGLALLAVEVRGVGLFVCPWGDVPWRESERSVAPRGRGPKRVVRSRTVGAGELAAWRVRGDCYLAGYAVTVRVEVCDAR